MSNTITVPEETYKRGLISLKRVTLFPEFLYTVLLLLLVRCLLHISKMFKCSVCDTSFTAKSSMLRHTKSHNQIKFQCVHCKKDFNRRDHLADHVQKKHGMYYSKRI